MSEVLTRIVALVGVGDVRISAHGYDDLAEDDILAGEVIAGVEAAVLIEEYPTYAKGPCVRSVHRVDHGLSTRSGSLERGFPAEEAMNVRRHTKFVREGAYGAEVDVELIDEGNGWSPYLSLDDARKLDAVREALRRADLEAASRLARVFSFTPVRL